MGDMLQNIFQDPFAAFLIIANLILIESLLSVDNAAVLATMVKDMQPAEQKKALVYGIAGAYIFRGVCLLSASIIIKIWWLKPIGGIYLVYLFFNWLRNSGKHKAQHTNKTPNKFRSYIQSRIGNFWATIILVEIMDLAFSMDNIFAAVALSNNILIIITGVFIGMFAMRFVAQAFVRLMNRFPFLESSAFIVIGILGLKLILSVPAHFYPTSILNYILERKETDWFTSCLTIAIFLIPISTAAFFGFPSKSKETKNN